MQLNRKVILGSASPRRQELLRNAGFDFKVVLPDVEETWSESMELRKVPEFLASIKSDNILSRYDLKDAVLITADTIVLLNGEIIGKPSDRNDALSILGKLSGQTHEVITGVSIISEAKTYLFSDTTEVSFHPLGQEEIAYYVDNYKPYDKAGAYAIQEWIGHIGIRKINGCFYNVMGLPIQRVYHYLKNNFQVTL